ncbi:MAG TPA: glycosyltransferase [Vicinamibacterales bacterium]|nr:glycosyltransferase [Vicinamibacterales bacterium]
MTTPLPPLLIYCQHSLGLGHLARTWALADALSSHFHVVLASGGEWPAGLEPPPLEMIDLPAVALTLDGRLTPTRSSAPIDEVLAARTRILRGAVHRLRPQVVVIELFPFGRRKFRGEILALLAEARRLARPVVAVSVRDLLVRRGANQADYDDRVRQTLDAHFDLVLVHADAAFASLEDTFRPSVPSRVPVHHTGFVVPADTGVVCGGARRGIVVSGGGGRFAEPLYVTAIDAHARLGPERPPMTIVAGPLCPDTTLERVRRAAAASPDVVVESTVSDLCRLLRTAALSVSQCGYNTALDILRARVPAIVVPFADNGDSEQTDRARRLERLNAVRVFSGALDAAALCAAMKSGLDFVPAATAFDLGGAAASAAILKQALDSKSLVAAAQS